MVASGSLISIYDFIFSKYVCRYDHDCLFIIVSVSQKLFVFIALFFVNCVLLFISLIRLPTNQKHYENINHVKILYFTRLLFNNLLTTRFGLW